MATVASKDGTMITYDQSGAGPALVLVAPAFGTRADEAALAAALAPSFTVFAYDRRGRGESSDTPPYAIAREVEDLEAVIDAAGGSASVWGLARPGRGGTGARHQQAGVARAALIRRCAGPPTAKGLCRTPHYLDQCGSAR